MFLCVCTLYCLYLFLRTTLYTEGPKPGTNKKRVSWAEDSKLVRMHIFELDESERGVAMCFVDWSEGRGEGGVGYRVRSRVMYCYCK